MYHVRKCSGAINRSFHNGKEGYWGNATCNRLESESLGDFSNKEEALAEFAKHHATGEYINDDTFVICGYIVYAEDTDGYWYEIAEAEPVLSVVDSNGEVLKTGEKYGRTAFFLGNYNTQHENKAHFVITEKRYGDHE